MDAPVIPHPANPKFVDRTDSTCGRMTVLRYAGSDGTATWWCRCECGTIVRKKSKDLVTVETPSCGCSPRYPGAKMLVRHGQSHTKEYTAWVMILARCRNPNDKGYPAYGGRGIECRFADFVAFIEDIGPRPPGRTSVDRIDTNGHYEPGNVRWATARVQANNRRNNRLVSVAGVTKTLSEWCGGAVTPRYFMVTARIRLGWCEACAVTLPKTGKRPASCSH